MLCGIIRMSFGQSTMSCGLEDEDQAQLCCQRLVSSLESLER